MPQSNTDSSDSKNQSWTKETEQDKRNMPKHDQKDDH